MRTRGRWWILGIFAVGIGLLLAMPMLRPDPIHVRPRPSEWNALASASVTAGSATRPSPQLEQSTSGGSGSFQVLVPPGGSEGGAEWAQIRDLLGSLREGDGQKAREAIKAIAKLLAGSPELQGLALKELLRLDRAEAGFPAGVLATAIGRVPDSACAMGLLEAAKSARGPDVVLAIVRSLGQNRYGLEVPPGAMTISSTFTDNNTPIQEEGVRRGLLSLVEACRGRREAVAQTLLHSTVEVLSFSLDDPAVLEVVSRMASGDDKSERSVALQALAVGRAGAAVESLAGALTEARDSNEVRAAAMGLVRVGTPDAVGRVLSGIRDSSVAVEARIGMLDSLFMLSAGPHTPEQEIAGCVLECMSSDDIRIRDAAVRTAGGIAGKGVASDELFARLLAMARDTKLPDRTRGMVLTSLRPRRSQREATRTVAEELLVATSSGMDLRTASLNCLENQLRPEDVEEFLRSLAEWKQLPQLASLAGQIDEAASRSRKMRERAEAK